MSHEWVKACVALLVLGLLIASGLKVGQWHAEAVPQESMEGITKALFGYKDEAGVFHWGFLFPFELLSVLLLAALIGALYVGQKTRRDPGGHA
jgi:NADH:ubiquinone oxidoreductase subunit 6 (subunit J)